MKSGRLYSMATSGQDIAIDLDPPSTPRGRGRGIMPPPVSTPSRGHSRSASWSFTRGQVPLRTDLANLPSINPMTPITTVIREIVPSLSRLSRNSSSSGTPRLSRDSSLTSVARGEGDELLGEGGAEDETNNRDPSLNVNLHLQGTMNNGGTEEQNIGLEISDGIWWLEHNALFIILLLLKFAWYHRSGLMVILGMFGTYVHCNQTIRKEVALKNRRRKTVLLLIILFLAANVYFVYYVFWEQRLHNCLYFTEPHFVVDLSNLLWSIWVTDYIIRFGTMALKAFVAAFFISILPSRKKGKYYMLFEYISQFYRTLVPTPLWVRYLSNPSPNGAVFAVIITAGYLMVKGGVILTSARDLFRAVINFIKDPRYGVTPCKEDLEQCNHTCAICQERFSRPVMLKCRHTFCENCVLQWFDRQNSCPLCRSTIANYDPKWRDGSTATWPQLF